MIKLITITKEETDIKSTYSPEVRTYNIVSGLMADDCKPFRVAHSVMIWIAKSGHIGEIECIYPNMVEKQICSFKKSINRFVGLPVFEILCCDNEACIRNQGNSFIIWLNNEKIIDTEIQYKQLRFFVSNQELVGIECKEYMEV